MRAASRQAAKQKVDVPQEAEESNPTALPPPAPSRRGRKAAQNEPPAAAEGKCAHITVLNAPILSPPPPLFCTLWWNVD